MQPHMHLVFIHQKHRQASVGVCTERSIQGDELCENNTRTHEESRERREGTSCVWKVKTWEYGEMSKRERER